MEVFRSRVSYTRATITLVCNGLRRVFSYKLIMRTFDEMDGFFFSIIIVYLPSLQINYLIKEPSFKKKKKNPCVVPLTG